MYDPEDITRSIRRYLGLMLVAPWSVALQREEVRDDQRPAGVIELGQEKNRFARDSIPQGDRINFAPVTISLYPALGEPRVAGRAARQLAGDVRDLFQVGGDGVVFQDGRRACGPNRIPMWDYAAADPGTPGPQFPLDVMRVEDVGVDAMQDPLDARRYSVIAELRVSWELPGREAPTAPFVADVPVVDVPPGDPVLVPGSGYVTGQGP